MNFFSFGHSKPFIPATASSISIPSSVEDDSSSASVASLSSSPASSIASYKPSFGRKMASSRSSSRESASGCAIPSSSSQRTPMAISSSLVESFVQSQAQAQAHSNASFSSLATSHNSPTIASNVHSAIYSSSMVPSPEPLRGRDLGPVPISSFQLPESVLTHRMSATSLQQHTPPSSIHPGSSSVNQEPAKQNGGIIRRISNASRAASKVIARRRPSSAHPNSRDVSVGPGILRRRSDSNNTAPNSETIERAMFDTESDSDVDLRDDGDSFANSSFDAVLFTDGSVATTNGTSSVNGSMVAAASSTPAQVGPVIPLALLHGIPIRKVSKKNNNKRIVLTLDSEAGKVLWDKARPTKCVYIDDIKEIRTAEDIRQYRLDCNVPESEEARFFSILYTVPDTTQTKLMHLIADTDESFMDWTSTLDAIYKHRQDMMASLMSFNDRAVRDYWNREMAKQSSERISANSPTALAGEIDFAGVERVCRNLHIHVPQGTLRGKFNEVDVHNMGRLNYAGFQEFVRLMKRRGDIQAIYRSVASNPALGITREEFFDFLRNTQGENVDDDLAHWEGAFARFARRPKISTLVSAAGDADSTMSEAPRLTETGFSGYITSTYNVTSIKEPKDYSFDRPMNEYYISSSHNTYLLGRQLAGTSSTEGYIAALTRGCRCVEIDCWDGADGQPIVVHGKTWTSSISFRETINTINRYAFIKSPYPLWISLEVHCNPEQQRIMARIMREVFGGKLVTEPLRPGLNRLPSPSELKHRILIKTKKTQQLPAPFSPLSPLSPPAYPPHPAHTQTVPFPSLAPLSLLDGPAATTGEFTGRRRGNSLPTQFSASQASPILSTGGVYSIPPSPRKVSTPKARVYAVDTITEGEVSRDVSRELPRESPSNSTSDCESGSEKVQVKQKQSKIVYELGSLAVYCMGVHKTTPFEDADCKLFNHILSWDEQVYEKHTKTRDSRQSVYYHNMRYMMRVYPKAMRIGSSNFNPLAHWRRGVQMAALNWQTYDLGMQINAAMFTGGTDSSGYVLKPREARQMQVIRNLPGESKPRDLKRERKNINFSISVVSAQQLMRPVNFSDRRTLDPYVEIEVFLADDKRDRDEDADGSGGAGGGSGSSGKLKKENLPQTPLVYRTKITPENGFNPIFDQRFDFKFTTKHPDLVFVRLSVKLAENGKYTSANPTASFMAKLSNLKQGFRTIPLVDVNADRYMFSTLLCEIRKEPITSVYVPSSAMAMAMDTMSETSSISAVSGTAGSNNKLKSIRTVFNRSGNTSSAYSSYNSHTNYTSYNTSYPNPNATSANSANSASSAYNTASPKSSIDSGSYGP
ncbi:phosphoinositide-specific phospholipase c [Ophiostoma piceae UAMH 11346]|uniref:Phosphoinositide phospholipase C n=1 Tax=Ophiostoma piceae (strain UAMH 11346) TaxID=1262450 RepID=S3BUU6_OPHP1|nr:phosphoinositide-specific phospholipase c [Ophiostoma piceae UAMH 11346]